MYPKSEMAQGACSREDPHLVVAIVRFRGLPMGFVVWGVGFGIRDLGCRVWSFGVKGEGCAPEVFAGDENLGVAVGLLVEHEFGLLDAVLGLRDTRASTTAVKTLQKCAAVPRRARMQGS